MYNWMRLPLESSVEREFREIDARKEDRKGGEKFFAHFVTNSN